MPKPTPRGGGRTPQERQTTLEASVLERLAELHPDRLTVDELALSLGASTGGSPSRTRWGRPAPLGPRPPQRRPRGTDPRGGRRGRAADAMSAPGLPRASVAFAAANLLGVPDQLAQLGIESGSQIQRRPIRGCRMGSETRRKAEGDRNRRDV